MPRRRFPALCVGAAVALSGLALSACGSTSKGASAQATRADTRAATASTRSAASATNPIARAALLSAEAPGERVHSTLSAQAATAGRLSIAANGRFDNHTARGALTATLSLSGANSLGLVGSFLNDLTLDLVAAKDELYLRVPPTFQGLLSNYTDGKSWVSLDLAQLASSSHYAGLAALLGGAGGISDPSTALQELSTVGAGAVHKVGTTTANGASATEYRATVNVSKLTTLPGLQASRARRVLSQITAAGITQIPYDVDVDAAGRISRVASAFEVNLAGTKVPVSLTTDFLDYGTQTVPAAPAASQTENINGLLSTLG